VQDRWVGNSGVMRCGLNLVWSVSVCGGCDDGGYCGCGWGWGLVDDLVGGLGEWRDGGKILYVCRNGKMLK
jgi:hypothetical protein